MITNEDIKKYGRGYYRRTAIQLERLRTNTAQRKAEKIWKALNEYNESMGRAARATLLLILIVMSGMGSMVYAQDIDFNKLADAIYIAEGGSRAVKPYGILRDYCKAGDRDGKCRKGCIQTINKRLKMWSSEGEPGDFISYLSKSYCPIGASNDPKGLNKNWVKNVSHFYNKEV